jgi:hypothetical protein
MKPTLTNEQRALLTLLGAAGFDGATAEGLLLAVKEAGFDDFTLDDVRGKLGLQSLAVHGLAEFRVDRRWRITRKGKIALQ